MISTQYCNKQDAKGKRSLPESKKPIQCNWMKRKSFAPQPQQAAGGRGAVAKRSKHAP
jgi:hypothetical protein